LSVRSIFALSLGIGLALALGLWSAWLAVRSPAPIDAISIGPWQAWPNAGTADVDPYSRARLARTGEVPLGSGEGLMLLARTDDRGAPLVAGCDYLIAGQTPPARLWTLSVEDEDGRVLRVRGEMSAIASDMLLRGADGSFEIALSDTPRAGNWIAVGGAPRFRVVVRLYDTTVRMVTALTTLTMPRISREGCA
jgi:hypothetical protein